MVRGPGWRPAENDADAAKIAEGTVAENAKALGDEIASIYGKKQATSSLISWPGITARPRII
jgi:hypothetical protein